MHPAIWLHGVNLGRSFAPKVLATSIDHGRESIVNRERSDQPVVGQSPGFNGGDSVLEMEAFAGKNLQTGVAVAEKARFRAHEGGKGGDVHMPVGPADPSDKENQIDTDAKGKGEN